MASFAGRYQPLSSMPSAISISEPRLETSRTSGNVWAWRSNEYVFHSPAGSQTLLVLLSVSTTLVSMVVARRVLRAKRSVA